MRSRGNALIVQLWLGDLKCLEFRSRSFTFPSPYLSTRNHRRPCFRPVPPPAMSDADIDFATLAIQRVESTDGHESDTASNSSYETAVPPGSPRNTEHENDVDRESTVSTLVTLPSGYGLSRWKPWKSWKRRSTAKESVRAAIRDFVLRHHGFCGPRYAAHNWPS